MLPLRICDWCYIINKHLFESKFDLSNSKNDHICEIGRFLFTTGFILYKHIHILRHLGYETISRKNIDLK